MILILIDLKSVYINTYKISSDKKRLIRQFYLKRISIILAAISVVETFLPNTGWFTGRL